MFHLNPFLPAFTHTFFKQVNTGPCDVLACIPSHHLKQSWLKQYFHDLANVLKTLITFSLLYEKYSRQFNQSSNKKMKLLFMLLGDLGLIQKCILKHCTCVLLYWLIRMAINWFELEIWTWTQTSSIDVVFILFITETGSMLPVNGSTRDNLYYCYFWNTTTGNNSITDVSLLR